MTMFGIRSFCPTFTAWSLCLRERNPSSQMLAWFLLKKHEKNTQRKLQKPGFVMVSSCFAVSLACFLFFFDFVAGALFVSGELLGDLAQAFESSGFPVDYGVTKNVVKLVG